jgi:RNA recognition motif-containing protein
VVLDETGTSKGFGFIRFGNEIEQQTALTSMQGISGLGGKPIKVKNLIFFFHDTAEKQYF